MYVKVRFIDANEIAIWHEEIWDYLMLKNTITKPHARPFISLENR